MRCLALLFPLLVAVPAAAAEPVPGLTFDAAVARALEHNPDLAAAAAGVRAAEAARLQAGARPNPALTVEAEEFGGDRPGFREAELTFGVVQPLETGGKRAARLRERAFAVDVARAGQERARRELLAEVRRRFVRALGEQERERILAAAADTAAAVEETVAALVGAGEASGIERSRARTDAALARLELEAARAELRAARRELVALWNGSEAEAAALAGPALPGPEAPPLEAVLARIGAGPERAVTQGESARRAAALDVERRRRWPDVELEVGRRSLRATGEGTWVAGLTIGLPLFDRNAGAIREAAAEVERARAEDASAGARLRGEAAAAHERHAAARRLALELERTVLPEAREVVAAYNEGYRHGKFRLLDLLDARRALVDAELRLNAALVQLGTARADLERLAGPLEG